MLDRISICLAALGTVSLLCGCINDDQARGHVVENEVLAGFLYAENGDPAGYAEVSAVPVEYVPNKGLLKSGADTVLIRTYRTDASGRFEAKGLPKGQYNLIGRWKGSLSLQDSVVVDDMVDSIPADTLRAPGSLTGTVELEPNHDPRTVFIQVLGTSRFVDTDSLGRFTLGDMAEGRYSLRILTTYAEYTPRFIAIQVRSGRNDTLSQPIRLAYTGIPVVRGLVAAFDTATGEVHLSWRAARYSFLKEYLIYRKSSSSLEYPFLPIARAVDTALTDALGQVFLDELGQTGSGQLEYQVRIRNLSNDIGLPFGSALADAAPASSIATSFDFKLDGYPGLEAGIGDTVKLIARFTNPGRMQDSLYWQMDGDTRILRATALDGRQGFDTLSLALPDKAGGVTIRTIAKDKAGSRWMGQATVMVVLDVPIADAGPDIAVTVRDTVRLLGKGRKTKGRIAKYEWNIGPGGAFQPFPGGEAIFVSGDVGRQILVLRVSDEQGFAGLDSMQVTSYDDIPRLTLGSEARTFADGGGYKLTAAAVDRGRIANWEWSIGSGSPYVTGTRGDTSFFPTQPGGTTVTCKVRATDDDGHVVEAVLDLTVSKWSYVGKLPLGGSSLAEIEGKLYAVGGERNGDPGIIEAYEVDPKTGRSTPIKTASSGYPVVAGNGKLFTVIFSRNPLGLKVYEWDPRLDEWSLNQFVELKREWSDFHAAFLNGKIYVGGGTIQFSNGNSTWDFPPFLEIDPVRFESKTKPKIPDTTYSQSCPGMVGLNGVVYAIGAIGLGESVASNSGFYIRNGFTGSNYYQYSGVWAYDVATEKWSEKASLPVRMALGAPVTVGGKLFLIGGSDGKKWNGVLRYDPASDAWEEKSPMLFDVADDAATVLGGKIYAVDPNGNLQVYDPSTEP